MPETEPPHALRKEEIDQLIQSAEQTRDRLILSVLYETGCTVSELINIDIRDTDTNACVVRFKQDSTRNGAARAAHVSPTLCHQLAHYCLRKKPEQPLFSSRQSERLTTKRVRQVVQKLGRQALDHEITPQTLRYTHIAHALAKNIPLPAIQQQVGLDNLRMSQLASLLAPKRVTNAYEAFFTA